MGLSQKHHSLTLSELVFVAATEIAANHALANRAIRSEDTRRLRAAVRVGLDDLIALLHREQAAQAQFEQAQAHALAQLSEEYMQDAANLRVSLYLNQHPSADTTPLLNISG